MGLTDARARALKPNVRDAKHSDGGGLYLHVTPSGSKLWRMAYRFGGKQKLLSFGAYPATSLSLARQKRDQAKALLAAGTDPAEQAKTEKRRKQDAALNTFEAVADELIAKNEKEGKAEGTVTKKRWLLGLARTALGARPIADITAPEILTVLRKIEEAGNYETARRLRAVIGQVFRYAIATGRADTDPTFGLRGALVRPVVNHHAAIVDREAFSGLVKAVWDYDGSAETRAALQLMVLLYPRPGELRRAEWSEFDLKKRVWTIPASRMKMRREHRKPLPKPAVKILTDLRELKTSKTLVFPSVLSRGKPISENTLNAALRRMGFSNAEATSHGFRSSASTLLNESGRWSPDAIEAELAHAGADSIRRTYHRGAHWEERVKMCEWWAKEIETFALRV